MPSSPHPTAICSKPGWPPSPRSGPTAIPQLSEVWFLAEGDTIRLSLNTSRQKTKNIVRAPGLHPLHPRPGQRPSATSNCAPTPSSSPTTSTASPTGSGPNTASDLRLHDQPGPVTRGGHPAAPTRSTPSTWADGTALTRWIDRDGGGIRPTEAPPRLTAGVPTPLGRVASLGLDGRHRLLSPRAGSTPRPSYRKELQCASPVQPILPFDRPVGPRAVLRDSEQLPPHRLRSGHLHRGPGRWAVVPRRRGAASCGWPTGHRRRRSDRVVGELVNGSAASVAAAARTAEPVRRGRHPARVRPLRRGRRR